jgi:transglutaminase-like putative cysteine protease
VRYLIRHETRLAFATRVREQHCELRLAPVDDATQRRLALRLTVEPAAQLHAYADAFGNVVHHFDVLEPHDALVTRLETEVETLLANPFDYAAVAPLREREWIADALRAHPPLWDFVLHRSAFTPDLAQVAGGLPAPPWEAGTPLVEAIQAGMRWIATLLDYVPGASDVDTPLATVLECGGGVCQDFAHLLVALMRGWGVPARYVVGYLDPGYREGAQATHAWAEVLVPGAGWRGADAVHQLFANDTYVKTAVGRDYRDAAPQHGTFQGAHAGGAPAVTLAVVRCQQ